MVWRARRRLARLVRQGHFDVVVTHGIWPHVVFGPAAQRAGARLVNWCHDTLKGPSDRFEGWASRTPPDLAIANSKHTAQTVPLVFSTAPVQVLMSPVAAPQPMDEPAVRGQLRAELNTPPADLVLLQVSRLERWKGNAVLIEALGLLRDEPGWTCWMGAVPQKAGEAEFLAELRQRATELGVIDRIRFLDRRPDVRPLFVAADVLVQPNTHPEPLGLVFIEALYASRPVVTSDLGGGAEIVTAQCGVLVPPADPAAAAAAYRELIRQPDRRVALGQAGPVRARQLCDPAQQLARLARMISP